MSKYQKALEIVKHPMKYSVEEFGEAIEILQKLVNKETITKIDLLTDLYITDLYNELLEEENE